ncbi:MAG: hypothetical protein EP343_01710 [Deltaproteobacteria bacterium]|nr:MAG: hypothetical protein EP343_01710 [Deltaproteobacteria bacterium]
MSSSTESPTFLTEHVSLLPTEDGSYTLFHHDVGASYRSVAGATTESEHVFLQGSGLPERSGEWRVLELGLGGGINFLCTALAALQRSDVTFLKFWSVEREPLPAELFNMESYVEWVPNPSVLSFLREASDLAAKSHGAWSEVSHEIDGTTILLSVFHGNWKDAGALLERVHAVYHDPFGPQVNADAWTEECFRWSAASMLPDARLGTYSSAGAVRRAMAAAGLHWRKVPGPGRKREVTIASPSLDALPPR